MTLIIAVVLVLLSSALCSGSEAALLSLPLSKARQLAEEGGARAQRLLVLRENLSRPISTIVILNNIANIVGSITVGALAAEALGSAWLGLFSAALTAGIIVFSEIIPKTLGARYAASISLLVAGPIALLVLLLTPLVWLMERITSLIAESDGPVTDEDEIRFLVRAGSKAGELEDDEEQMILNVFRLNDVEVGTLMTPRTVLTRLKGSDTLDEQRDIIINSQHTRIVVVGEEVDEVRGIALQRDLLVAMVQGQGDFPVSDYVRPVDLVSMDMKADALIPHFQERQQHLAVVIGPHGGVEGVVTMEDLIEVITGEIVDETDRAVDLRELARKRAELYLGKVLR